MKLSKTKISKKKWENNIALCGILAVASFWIIKLPPPFGGNLSVHHLFPSHDIALKPAQSSDF